MSNLSENDIEQEVIKELEAVGYSYINGQELGPDSTNPERNWHEVVLQSRLADAIARLNPSIPVEAQEEAVKKLTRRESPNLYQDNYRIHKYLTEGVPVEYRNSRDGRIVGDRVWVLDFEDSERNEFLVVNQFTIKEGNSTKRPDLILFVNGLPLVVIELKRASDESATLQSAFQQLQTYKESIPLLFQYNALLIVSNGWDALYGSLTAAKQFFVPWKTVDGVTIADPLEPQVMVMVNGLLNKQVLPDLIRHFVLFHRNREKISKIVPRHHQYYAVNKAVITTEKAIAAKKEEKRAGVVWHTQGSGKSLTMVFYAGKLVLALKNPTLVVLTDRNDLDDQLFETFSQSSDLLRQTPVQAQNRHDLKEKLKVAAGGIVFTTIQKFLPEVEERIEIGDGKYKTIKSKFEQLSDRHNIVVIADEAHRSQYDFQDGFARNLRDALPNASFIGFTGTPIETTDRNTQQVFGEYIDIYDIQQAVEDGATVGIFYENRLAKIILKEEEIPRVDEEFEELTEAEEESTVQRYKSRWARLEAIVGNEHRLAQIAQDIVAHYESRTETLEGKAMIVCMSRRICVELYNEIIKIRPYWHSDDDAAGAIKVVMTGSSSDPLSFRPHVRAKSANKAIGERLKDPSDSLKIAIVRDMWLTGFDAPSLHTLYVDKPMKSHNLMQAIARVNRVYKDKTGGLVVDYIGIAANLKNALAEYTASGGKGKPTYDIEEAVNLLQSKYEIVAQMFSEKPVHGSETTGLDYKQYFSMSNRDKLRFPLEAQAHIMNLDNGKKRFIDAVLALSKAYALAKTHPYAAEITDEVSLFQAIKARLAYFTDGNVKGKTDEELDTAIRQILSNAIASKDVVDIFEAAGISKPDISILSDEFLAEVRGMPYRSLAIELLKKLLKDEIKSKEKVNITQARKFSEMLLKAVQAYKNNLITSAEIIDEMVHLGKEMREAYKKGEELNLDFRELAFYSALEDNESATEILGDEILRHIARELVVTLKNNTSIDWTIRESVQARMRIAIKRILRKHGYPPDQTDKAIANVLEQANRMAEDLVE